MGNAVANLSGSGSQQVWINTYRSSQNQGGNYSQFYGELRYYGNGYGSWTNNTQYWSVSGLGLSVSGTFTIPYANRNDTYTVLWAGYWNVGHDSAGNLGGFNISGSITTDHSSIGSGTATTSEPAPPRIPKRPSPPGTPTFSNLTPTSVTVSWAGSSDNGGSAIDAYLLRRNTVSPPESAGYVDSSANNTSRTVTGLQPGQTYYFGVYAHNGSADNGGYSNKSNQGAVTLPSGVYVSDGAAWTPQDLRVSDGSAWTSYRPKISDGTTWTDPVPL